MMLKLLSEKKVRDRFFLFLAFLLPVMIAMTTRILTLTSGEASYDAFYHAGIARLGPSVFLADKFPWTDSSVWKTAFADKELLYHAGLWLIFRIQELSGVAPEPPFHTAAMVYLLILSGAWVYAGHRFKVSPALLCAGSLLFAAICPNWTYRLVMLRPHIASIACFLFAAGFLAQGTFRKKLIGITVFSFFYSWLYSNPHFIVIPVLVYAVFAFRENRKNLLLPLCSLGAVLLGLLIHPQFPNSFTIWKLQSWDALISPLLQSHAITKPTEMMPPKFIWQMHALPLYVLAAVNLFFTIRLLEKKSWNVFPPAVYALMFLAAGFTGGIFLASRSIEYAAPLNVLLFLILIGEAGKQELRIPFRKTPRIAFAVLTSLALVLTVFHVHKTVLDARKAENIPPVGIAKWMRENLRENEAVINLDWSDFPALFHAAPAYRYQWGLDPVFSLAASRKRTEMLSLTRSSSRQKLNPRDYAAEFNCRYGILLAPRIPQANLLLRNGWRLVKEVKTGDRVEGWIFAAD